MNETDFKMFTLYQGDVEAARRALVYLESNRQLDSFLQEVLWREAIISYGRPFSGNRIDGDRHKIKVSVVPDDLRFMHDIVIDYRNKLVAHSDFDQVSHFRIGNESEVGRSNTTVISSMSCKFRSIASWSLYLKDFLSLVEKIHEYMNNRTVEWYLEYKGTDKG